MKKMTTKLFAALFALLAMTSTTTLQAFNVPQTGPHIHRLASFSEKDVLRMHDGSEWMAATPDEAFTAYSWRPNARIMISPNSGFFTSSTAYPFYLNNIDNGTYIRVSPVASPVHFGEFSFWVQNVNPLLGNVTLVHGQGSLATWEVSSSYLHLLREWEANDHIVVGVYDSYFPCLCAYNYVLINFNKAHFVQARPH